MGSLQWLGGAGWLAGWFVDDWVVSFCLIGWLAGWSGAMLIGSLVGWGIG